MLKYRIHHICPICPICHRTRQNPVIEHPSLLLQSRFSIISQIDRLFGMVQIELLRLVPGCGGVCFARVFARMISRIRFGETLYV
jgi:hypothetical protein